MFTALADRLRNIDLAALTLLGVAAVLAVATMLARARSMSPSPRGTASPSWTSRCCRPWWPRAHRLHHLRGRVQQLGRRVMDDYHRRRHRRGVLEVAPLDAVVDVIAVGGSLAMTVVGKRLTDRARPPYELAVPPYETSASFPSGHTLNSIVITGMFCYLLVSHLTNTLARVATITIGAVYTISMGCRGYISAIIGSPTCWRPGARAGLAGRGDHRVPVVADRSSIARPAAAGTI